MGKFIVISKVLDEVAALWRAFLEKSPVFIALSGLSVVGVLGLGVGGTLAATGVIPNPLESSPNPLESSSSAESAPEPEKDYSDQGRVPIGDGTLPSDVGEWGPIGCVRSVDEEVNCPDELSPDELGRRGNVLIQSGWTGVLYNFTKAGFYSYALVDVDYRDDVTSRLEINGRFASSGTIHDCIPTLPANRGHCSTMTNFPFTQRDFLISQWAICQPGGDTYVIEVSGGGYYFKESGTIPADVFDCPPVESTPSPTPESSSEPTPSPTPESSNAPESSPTPTP
jgi:hypothetical protein